MIKNNKPDPISEALTVRGTTESRAIWIENVEQRDPTHYYAVGVDVLNEHTPVRLAGRTQGKGKDGIRPFRAWRT